MGDVHCGGCECNGEGHVKCLATKKEARDRATLPSSDSVTNTSRLVRGPILVSPPPNGTMRRELVVETLTGQWLEVRAKPMAITTAARGSRVVTWHPGSLPSSRVLNADDEPRLTRSEGDKVIASPRLRNASVLPPHPILPTIVRRQYARRTDSFLYVSHL